MSKASALPRLKYPVVVEGRYDKSAILSMFSGVVITTEGFGIFNNKEKRALIVRLCSEGVIVLTDSDGGGKQIRSYLSGIIPKDKIINLYIPEIEGKERRKRRCGKAGLIGVEGVGGDTLRRILEPYLEKAEKREVGGIESCDMYSLGLTGADGSAELRDRLAGLTGLPSGMSAKAMLSALNLIMSRDEFLRLCGEIGGAS